VWEAIRRSYQKLDRNLQQPPDGSARAFALLVETLRDCGQGLKGFT